jgi:hypothetical protein
MLVSKKDDDEILLREAFLFTGEDDRQLVTCDKKTSDFLGFSDVT